MKFKKILKKYSSALQTVAYVGLNHKKTAMYNLPLTLLPRSKITLLLLDCDHFTLNIDNFTPIQKVNLAPQFI